MMPPPPVGRPEASPSMGFDDFAGYVRGPEHSSRAGPGKGPQGSRSGEIWVESAPRDSALSPKSSPHRATSMEVAGQAQLVIPDCIIRFEDPQGEAADADGLSVAPPPPRANPANGAVRNMEASGELVNGSASEESQAASEDEGDSVPLPPRTRTYSAPAIAVEDHELEEVLDDDEEILDESHLHSEPPPTPAKDSAGPPKPPSAPLDDGPEEGAGWHEDFFEHGEGLLVACGGDAEAGHDVEFILRCVSLTAGQKVLDVGCGAGRHCFAFADLGYEIVGVDRSARQLSRATERNRMRRQKVKFDNADMRSLRYGAHFDLVTCLGTTLGYYSDKVNRECLKQMKDCLRPGGRLVLHCVNRDYVVANVPCRSWWSDEGALVLDEVDFDYARELLRVKRTMLSDSGRQSEHLIQIRAYGLREMRDILHSIGMQVVEYSGSRGTRGYFYGTHSTDLWLVAQKPA